jgi:peptidoglycan hydrolase-like protein with peptidoglycan-binding domain
MIRALLGRQQLYIRVTDDRNRRRSDTFDIRGVDDVAERVAAACGWSTLALTNADYRQIQGLLQRAGHYAGAIDGDWGPQSRAAMRAFQEANGLAVTGAPDQDSLNLLNE